MGNERNHPIDRQSIEFLTGINRVSVRIPAQVKVDYIKFTAIVRAASPRFITNLPGRATSTAFREESN